jgi:hypothetical protein
VVITAKTNKYFEKLSLVIDKKKLIFWNKYLQNIPIFFEHLYIAFEDSALNQTASDNLTLEW